MRDAKWAIDCQRESKLACLRLLIKQLLRSPSFKRFLPTPWHTPLYYSGESEAIPCTLRRLLQLRGTPLTLVVGRERLGHSDTESQGHHRDRQAGRWRRPEAEVCRPLRRRTLPKALWLLQPTRSFSSFSRRRTVSSRGASPEGTG